MRIKDHWREQRLFDQRALVCAALMGLATVGLVPRLFLLQVTRHDYYSDLSQGKPRPTEPNPARFYPNGGLAVHALGYGGAISEQDLKRIDRNAYAGTSLIGKLGVESTYEH